MTSSELSALGMVRLADEVLLAQRDPCSRPLLLPLASGRYARVPVSALPLLRDLVRADTGLSVEQVRREFPGVSLERLVELGVVAYVPPHGLPIPRRLVAELVSRNIAARCTLRSRPRALVRLATPSPSPAPVTRPLLFDQVEAAVQVAVALPGTSSVCTVVALSIVNLLRSRGYPAHVQLLAEPEQVLAHAVAAVGRHRVDLSTSDLALVPLLPLLPRMGDG